MTTRYDVNEFNEVVPYVGGRKSNDTRNYRELTEYEEQLLEEIKELEKQNGELIKKINKANADLETFLQQCYIGSFERHIYNIIEYLDEEE